MVIQINICCISHESLIQFQIMQEQKSYILHSIKCLLNLEEAPYELSNSQAIDKFITTDQDTLAIAVLPSKQVKVLGNSPASPDSTVIQISKFKNDSALVNFYNFSLRPAVSHSHLSKQIAYLYEPIALRTKNSGLVQVKELQAVLESELKRKLNGETDLSFCTLEQEIDFWQELDVQSPSTRVAFFIAQYAPISKSWKESVGGVQLGKLGTLIETTWAVISKIWDSPNQYHEKRLVRLVEVFEGEIRKSIRLAFARENDLLFPTFDIRQMLVEALQCCNRFLAVSERFGETVRRKAPLLKTKTIQELRQKILGTLRTKSKVELLLRLFESGQLKQDPASLMFLVKAQNFMSSFTSQFQNNPKAVAKLEKQKQKFSAITGAVLPLFAQDLNAAADSPYIQSLLKILEKWFYFLSEPQFIEHTVDHQNSALKKGIQFLQKYYQDQLKRLQYLPNEPQKLRVLKGVNKRVLEVDALIKQFAQNADSMPAYIKKMDKLNEQLKNKEQQLIKSFVGRYQACLTGKQSSRVVGREVIDLTIGEKGIQYSFGIESGEFIESVEEMLELGLSNRLGDRICKAWQLAKRFHKENSFVISLQSRFNWLQSCLQFFQKHMLQKELKEVKETVDSPRSKKKSKDMFEWKDPEQLSQFGLDLNASIDKMTAYLKLFNTSESEIESISLQLLAIPFTPNNFFVISQKLDQIARLMDIVAVGRDSTLWRNHWCKKLTEVIELQWQQAMGLGITLPMTVRTILVAKNATYDPPLYQLKEKYFRQLKHYLGWPLEQKTLNGQTMLQRNASLVLQIYSKTQELFQSLEIRLNQYGNLQSKLRIDLDSLEQKLGRQVGGQQLGRLLSDLKQCRQLSENIKEVEKVGAITIDNIALKESFSESFGQMLEGVVQLLRFSIKLQSQQVQEFISGAMTKLQSKPTNMQQLGQVMREFDLVKATQQEIIAKIRKIEAKNTSIRTVTGASFNANNMLQRWENFQVAAQQMASILNEQRNRLQEEALRKAQGLEHEAARVYKKFQVIRPTADQLDRSQAEEIYGRIKDWQIEWKDVEEKYKAIENDIKHFGMKMPEFKGYRSIKQKLQAQLGNWLFFSEYRQSVETFYKEQWLTFRGSLNKYSELVGEFGGKAKQLKVMDHVAKFVREVIEDDRQAVQLLRCLTGQSFEKEHWGMLFSILKIKNISSAQKLTLGDLARCDLLSKANQIRQLQARSRGQTNIRVALDDLEAWAITRQFQLTQYNSMGRITALIKQWKDVMTEVSDHQALVASVKENKYSSRFKSEIQKYEAKLGLLDAALLKLNQIQRKWVYLEPIFMRGALPQEQGRWKRLDQDYRNIMAAINLNPHVAELSNQAGFLQTLTTIMAQLQRCQKALNDYLEQKRNKFPRFYFLGDDDMLEILGQSQNPAIIQLHLKKLFSGIHTVKFSDGEERILAMRSHLKEEVRLSEQIEVGQVVESWLEDLNKNMVITLKKQLQDIKRINIQDSFDKNSSQVICLLNELTFNAKAITAISSGQSALASLRKDMQSLLSRLTQKCHQTKEQLALAKIKSLILDVIHQIAIIQYLTAKGCQNVTDWTWYKQLKIVEDRNNVQLQMANATFNYSFQYQGNAQKLVYTPLTDKCYLTLTQAMHMGLGGNPYGPAGTGKTESVKALALAFGRQVLVFNCDEGLDFQSMGRIFIGLVKCGAWGCFDEFNRLLQEQLSAISQQIQVIQQAIKGKQGIINLLGKRVQVNFNSGIFVTLNPAGKGYGGRSKLPDNLKQLFRPVAMSIPDNELIAEVLLFAEGFKTAKILAQKIITIFTLSKQLLTKQLHYDWGLRALKTVLTVAGRLVFEEKNASETAERQILIKALRINTISKLTFADMLKFNVLVEDVFPGVSIKDIEYAKVTQALKQVFTEQNFQMLPNQLNKILQFYEATRQRIGAVLVGPSGCGKTTIWRSLKKAYQKLGQVVKVHLINPKAMPRSSFLGCMNNDTRQFSEGVLTVSARAVVKEQSAVLNWIICDGDVDPEWIQALNSVLDDNHLLTLPTGQRISFDSNVNFIFQTDHLQFASPATVSRMGMIFMNDEDININSIIAKWAKRLPSGQTFIAQQTSFIQHISNKVWELSEQQIVVTTKVGLVRSALSLIEDSVNQQDFKLKLVKGLASNFQKDIRGQIFEIVFGKGVPGGRDPLSLRVAGGKIGEFKDQQFKGVQKIYLTKQIKKDIEIVSHWLSLNSSVIIVGKEGCGKSLLLQASIQQLQIKQKCKMVTIHCNRQTKASVLIQKLYQTCQRATSANGKILKPLNCNRQIFVLKEINLARPDKYNTIELVTFLQSLISHDGFYDQNLEFVRIGQGIQFVCIMKPSSTIGRYEVTTRFVSNLRVLSVDYESVGTMQKLGVLTPHAEKINQKLSLFWNCLQQNFKADDNAHYLFCPRNLNSMVDSLQNYQIDMNNVEQIISALRNEAIKQFQDRLVDAQSKVKFNKLIEPIFGANKRQNVYSVVENKLKSVQRSEYLNQIEKTIKNYETDVKQVNLILIDEVINLMSSLQRKFVEGGSLLMAGVSGSLRKTVLKIMAFKHKLPIYSLSNLRNPSLKEFYRDMKAALEVAGGQNKKIILLLEQHQLGKSQFYQKINSLMSSGQISGLFNLDQIQGITQDPEVLKTEFFGKTLYESFIQRIKRNVIVILSLDHRSKHFYQVCSSNPAFYSSCRIIWLNCYSKANMGKIFEERTKQLNIKQINQIKTAIIKIHEGSSHTYMKLINNFIVIYNKTLTKSGNKLQKLTLGLKKLVQTAKTVDSLTAEAITKKKLLTIKQREADQSLNFITDAMQETSASKAEAQKLQVFLQVEQKKIEKDKKLVMAQLQKVLPLIQEAKVAVNGLTPKSIQQIRSFMNPPQAVRLVLKAVLALFGNRDDSWNNMKNFLKVCKDQILVFDIREVSQKIRNEVEAIITENAFYFQRQNVFKASQDAVPLAEWVKAAIQYSKTYEKIRPLEENLNKIEKQLQRSRIRYEECTQKVAESEKKIKELNQNFVKKTNQAQKLKQELKKAEIAQTSGQQLLSKLQDQKVRWSVQSDKLKVEVDMMPKYAAMTACFVTYLSQSPENIRHLQIQKWKKLFGCHFYNFLSFVTTEAITLQQVMKGLPNDQLSIQNSQIIAFLKQIPLLIDPHTQATTWYKQKMQGQNKVETMTQQDAKFLNTLQLSIRFGKILIIQEIDFIEPVLTQILKSDYIRQGARNVMTIGQKILDVNQSFRLILTTRNSSIEIATNQKDLVSIVNFSVTKSGLQGKLLSIIIRYFQPQIEREKQELLQQQEKLKINLSSLEQKLLRQLADSSGNILENKGLINSLNQTKAQSQIVTKSLKDTQKLQKILDEKREVYQIIAEIGSKLYISLSILKNLNPMYKFNLSQFITLFHEALQTGKVGGENQIQTIRQSLIKIVYNNISVGLLKSHRLLLALVFVREVFDNSIPEEQFNVLLGNVISTQDAPTPSWLEDKDKLKFKVFQSVVKSKQNFSGNDWSNWFNAHQCQEKIPQKTILSSFQVCLLTNLCRPDRLTHTLTNFVQQTLKLSNLSGLEANMKTLVQDKMTSTVPCLFIVSIGFDPSKQIQQYATKMVGKQKFEELSMGGDQNQFALQLLRQAAKDGKWLCLKNLHLVINFVNILEKEVLSMKPHQNFRLFLTTEMHEKFPPILLENCFKVSYEAPPGIKQNFTRILNNQTNNKDNKLEMIATFFHALIQQRRNYIPQGWNKFYEFNYGDYKSGLNVIREISAKKNWEMLYGLMLDTIYGGRIDNDVDRKLLDIYLHYFFNEDILNSKVPIFKEITINQIDKLIHKLPNIDNPDIYHLPMGIDKVLLRIKAKELIENLKLATIPSDSSTKFSRQLWGKTLTPLFTIWKGLKKIVTEENIKKIGDDKLKSVDPIESFVYGEYNEAVLNYTHIKIALQKLQGILFGNDILVTELEEIGKTLLRGETPSKWRKIWQGPDLVSDWLKIFIQKLNHLAKWVELTQEKQLLKQQLDLSEVYRPQIFLNAMKQKVGRQKKIPINELKIKSSFSSVSNEICLKIKKLILQGCSLQKDGIKETNNDNQYEELSILYIYFNEKQSSDSEYSLPFYTDMTRSTLLSMLPAICKGNKQKLVLASAAILLKDI